MSLTAQLGTTAFPHREGDGHLADIFSHSPVSTLLVDSSLVIRQVSDSYLRATGFGRHEIVGLNVYHFFDTKVSLSAITGSVRESIGTAIATRKKKLIERIPLENGTAWSIRTLPIFRHDQLQYLVMEIENTTEEHQRLLDFEARMDTNETFRILVDTVKDYAIFMLNPQGKIATWNAGAHRFKGYTKDEIIGKHFSVFYGAEDRANDKPGREIAIALREGRVEDEGWRYRKDGSKFWANVIITPVYKDDILLGFSKVTRDLTERRAGEARLIAAYEEAAKLKSEFLANMSHEIRTPMHGMLSALTLLLDTGLNPEQTELAHIIEESGGILLQVINDILDYSKLASGCFSISSDVISIPDIISSIFRSFQTTTSPDTVIDSQLDARLPKSAEGDPLRYRQIVQNLVSNATKFTESGYVHVKASLQDEDEESYIILTEVIDTGIGVPEQSVGSLFTPFTQFDNSATKRYKGTGLGLSICKSLVTLMGGQIGYRPNPDGQGSVFWFTSKLKKVKQLEQLDKLEPQLDTVAIAQFPDIKRVASEKKILLAEDNVINQKVMLKMLKGLGFDEIGTAIDGREAVSLVTNEPSSYDLILMDINMPVLDGVAATRELRNAGCRTPIIAMTANALKGHAESYLAKGMDDYIAKPVDRHLLTKALIKFLSRDDSP